MQHVSNQTSPLPPTLFWKPGFFVLVSVSVRLWVKSFEIQGHISLCNDLSFHPNTPLLLSLVAAIKMFSKVPADPICD